MYSANDLYNMIPESVDKDVGNLKGCYSDHLPEIEGLWDINSKNDKVEIKVLKDFDFDGRRCWTLRTVWFDSKPVMVVQNAGREGDDHYRRYITNDELFKDMVTYLQSLFEVDVYAHETLDLNEKLDCLTNFYGKQLNSTFERY